MTIPREIQLVADLMAGDWTEGEHAEVTDMGWDTYAWTDPEQPEALFEANHSNRLVTVYQDGKVAYTAAIDPDGKVHMEDMTFRLDEDPASGTWVWVQE